MQFLIDVVADEPGLAFGDVMNEPDWQETPRERVLRNFGNCKFMANTFHELDPNTPVTIGMAFVDGMIELADYVDVLQFHDYMQTRGQIRNNIMRAKEFAAKVDKPLINGEIGCIAHANPYDITLLEHMNAKVGWYIWELMIVREGWVTKIIDSSNVWLTSSDASWEDGLDIAETTAHLLEAGELTAMRIPPTWEVEMLRQGEVNFESLKKLVIKFRDMLEPYKVP